MDGQSRVYLLWHVRHAEPTDGSEIRHFAADDDFWADEEEGDDVKLLGVYSSRDKAQERIVRARVLPGFRDEPKCFYIEEFTVDADEWKDGFVTVMTGGEGSEGPEETG
ncbi:hypothetical protein JIX56_20570 [Streptomyces sp. CA-210063]|uniref:DUF7336 domain-containing protein n=1 Tax=Streptomyces sp. CA-210063 TaxID=2801029 RepID=UPI00214B206B|nr:hypothetical protein [Streptomyces sp. CA-210063]UUU32103.1 hypothetical protein JIX56_20570 [Streptomyces sp. CA-210063]